MNLKSLFIATAFVCVVGSSQAQVLTGYTVQADFDVPITNIMMLEGTPDGGFSMTWAFQANGNGATDLVNPFPWGNPPQQALLVGIVQGLPNDGSPEQKHMVLMMDNEAASLSNHIAWGTLFRNTLEDQLIADLELATSGQDWPIIQPGLDAISNFASGDAANGILGPGGTTHSAWFNIGGSFTVMAFSDGQVIGSGLSSLNPVPEPATMACLGLGLAAFVRRRSTRNKSA